MDSQRLRNITTGILHTEVGHLYEDLGFLVGSDLMTHMLPRAMDAVAPYLKKHVTDLRFWDGKFDTSHIGEFFIPEPSAGDRDDMFRLYKEQPDPLKRFKSEGRVIVAAVN